MRTRTDDLSPTEQEVLASVEADGLHVVEVPETADAPGCSYSVGLWHSFEQPEVIVFGLPGEIARDLLDAIADEAAEGVTFAAGGKHEGLLHGFPVRFVAVPRERIAANLPLACWAHEGDDFPVLQLVWPDKQGRWPWDPSTREGFREAQPVLGPQDPA
jgi:hypothetical protein